jgi:VWFA-related protein
MRRGSLAVSACLLAGLAAAPGLLSQVPPSDEPEILPPVAVELVRIDVVVTEKRGAARAGLRREDFVVLEDGEPQTIVQFQAFAGAAPGASPAAVAPEASAEAKVEAPPEAAADEAVPLRPARHVVLLVDDIHMEFGSMTRVKKALTRLVLEDLWPEDRVALLTTSGAGGSSHQFAADRAVLEQSIAGLSLQDRRLGWSGIPYMDEYQAELIEAGDQAALDVAVDEILRAAVCQDRGCAEALARQKARGVFIEAVQSSRLTLETVEGLMRGLRGFAGRKVVFLVSDGFLTGLAARSGAGFDLRRITDAGTKAGVVVYSLDARGLVASPPIASASSPRFVGVNQVGLIESMRMRSELAQRDALHTLAADTGGFLVDSSNDIRAGLRRMLKDTETYYVLAYEPTNVTRDGRFRRIEVRLPGHRDLKVRARTGYLATDDRGAAAALKAREAEVRRVQRSEALLKTALAASTPLTDISVSLSADFVSLEDGVPQVVVSGRIETPAPSLAQGAEPPVVTVDALAVIYDQNGEVTGNLGRDETSVDPSASSRAEVLGVGFDYQRTATLPPGRYQVRLVASEEATGRLGSAWQWVDIPELGASRLVLSSLFLLEAEAVAEEGGTDLSASPALRSVQAARRFQRDESLYLQYYAYNPRRDASGATRLVSEVEVLRDGVLVAQTTPEPIDPPGREGPPRPHTTRIGLQPFDPGDYELRVTVTDRNAKQMAMRWVDFTIE